MRFPRLASLPGSHGFASLCLRSSLRFASPRAKLSRISPGSPSRTSLRKSTPSPRAVSRSRRRSQLSLPCLRRRSLNLSAIRLKSLRRRRISRTRAQFNRTNLLPARPSRMKPLRLRRPLPPSRFPPINLLQNRRRIRPARRFPALRFLLRLTRARPFSPSSPLSTPAATIRISPSPILCAPGSATKYREILPHLPMPVPRRPRSAIFIRATSPRATRTAIFRNTFPSPSTWTALRTSCPAAWKKICPPTPG